MDAAQLQENLRMEILRRISRGSLSGAALARSSGFRHSHISNFLKGKRMLSMQGLDRILAAEKISIVDLLPASAQSPQNTTPPSVLPVPVVPHESAIFHAQIPPTSILDTLYVPDAILHLALARPAAGRISWQRFVAVRADAEHALAMQPILQQDSLLVLDRQYNSLAAYRPMQPTLYAVYAASRLHICFLGFEASRLILRPNSINAPVHLLELLPHEQPSDRIVGRVCYITTAY